MSTGALGGYLDIAQVVLYLFWGFFLALIIYLLRENKREGYPLEQQSGGQRLGLFFPPMPEPKTFTLADGATVVKPSEDGDDRPVAAEPASRFLPTPLEPTGDPLVDGVGPAAWAERADRPDLTNHGEPRLAPMRLARDFEIADGDRDPRKMTVIGTDGQTAGEVCEVWVDRAEMMIRYLEVERSGAGGSGRVLLPMTLSRIDAARGRVLVKSITAAQFASVPTLADPDRVTLLEEDKIQAYYTGGHLYATPERAEPLL